jgi:hypothetical protein
VTDVAAVAFYQPSGPTTDIDARVGLHGARACGVQAIPWVCTSWRLGASDAEQDERCRCLDMMRWGRMENRAALFLLPLLLLLSCGEPGPHFVGCTKQEEADGRRGFAIALKAFPESASTFQRMRISCELFDPWPGSECVTWSYATNTADGLAEFRIDLVGECLLHEAQHYELRAIGIKE